MSKYLQTKERKVLTIEDKLIPYRRGIPKNFFQIVYWMECFNCRKKFAVPLKRYNQGVGKFCSKKCTHLGHRGTNNPHFTNGNRINRVAWTIRKRLVNKYKKCQNCGFDKFPEALEIDHIVDVRNGGNTHDSNLQVLCANCHRFKTIRGTLPLST